MDPNGVIGVNGKLPWHIPEEMAFFRSQTLGEAVVMGRKTYESIGRPLARRINVVLSSDPKIEVPGGMHADSVKALLTLKFDKIFCIGGAEVYEQLLPFSDEIIVSYVPKVHIPDGAKVTRFPLIREEDGNYFTLVDTLHKCDKFVACKFRRRGEPQGNIEKYGTIEYNAAHSCHKRVGTTGVARIGIEG